MINLNGKLLNSSNLSLGINRAFLYGDALFDTLLFSDNTFYFLEDHYFRLLASMRQLRMEIPSNFTQTFWKNEILKTLDANNLSQARIRTNIYRESKGLYLPDSNTSNYLIQVAAFSYQTKITYSLGVYKDSLLNTGSLSNIKTTNRLENILASIYAKENGYDSCILLNHKKQIAETIHANLFILTGNSLKTPSLDEGCVQGIIRKKIINIVSDYSDISIEETSLNIYDVLQADEVFISNSLINIQPITHFKKRSYTTDFSSRLLIDLQRIKHS